MAKDVSGTAGLALRQQVEIFGRDGVSLTSLWRAAGRPRGHDPKSWSRLAEPLIEGYARYLTGLDPDADSPAVWTWDGIDGEPWRLGDLMGRGDLAQVYAAYLDAIDARPAPLDLGPALRRGC